MENKEFIGNYIFQEAFDKPEIYRLDKDSVLAKFLHNNYEAQKELMNVIDAYKDYYKRSN